MLGRAPTLATQRIHPPDRGGDRRAVHLLDVGRPVEDGGVEGEDRLIIGVQGVGQGQRVVVHEVQLGLRVLVVEREVAAQEVQPDPGAIEIAGELAGGVRPRGDAQHPFGEAVRSLRRGEEPLHRGRARETATAAGGSTPRTPPSNG